MRSGHQWFSQDDSAVLQTTAETLLSEFPFYRIIDGWIPSTFQVAQEHLFRFVHVDVDFIRRLTPTSNFYYPRLVPGGIILLDDYGFVTCPGAYKAVLEYFDKVSHPVIELLTGQAFVIRNSF